MEPRVGKAPSAGVRSEQRRQEDPAKARESKSLQGFGPNVLLAKRLALPHPDSEFPRFHGGTTYLSRLGHRILQGRPGCLDGSQRQGFALRHLDDPGQVGKRRDDTSWIQSCLDHGHESESRLLHAYL